MSYNDYKKRLEAAKAVPIEWILAHEGFHPVRQNWYHSPFREDKNPSFRIYQKTNTWADYGSNERFRSGDGINLIEKMHNCGFNEAVDYILSIRGDQYLIKSELPPLPISSEREDTPQQHIDSIREIKSPALTSFLTGRRIPLSIANKFCSEVHYTHIKSGRRYFGIGIMNDNGGWAIRTAPYGGRDGDKLDIIASGITTIRVQKGCVSNRAYCFEGFFNFLAWCAIFGMPDRDIYILNSCENAPKLSNIYLTGTQEIGYYRDNDIPGLHAFDTIATASGCTVIDLSSLYAKMGYNDLNDYLIATNPIKAITP